MKYLIRILENRKKSKNFTFTSNMGIDDIAIRIKCALKNNMFSETDEKPINKKKL